MSYEAKFKVRIGYSRPWWSGFYGGYKLTKRGAYKAAEKFLKNNDGEWPVVKIVNTKTGEVFYLTRHDPS